MKKYLAARKSYLIAVGLIVAVGVWLASGQFQVNSAPANTKQPNAQAFGNPKPLSVQVRVLEAQNVTREVVVSGRTEAGRAVALRAETIGRVVAIHVKRGVRVKKGAIIAELDMGDRQATLRETRAAAEQRRVQYDAALQLLKRKLMSTVAVAESRANLEAARAAVKRIEVEIARTKIRVPFDGVLDERPVEIGDYVKVGDIVARVLDPDPMIIVGDVAQQDMEYVRRGVAGRARLVTGRELPGKLRYVSSQADQATRTFRVELEVPNPDGQLVAGMTSEIRIATNEVKAHYLSPALLSLGKSGVVGVKVVNTEDVVEFHQVEIVRAGAEGVWVTGLPSNVRVITVGHGFVRAGEHVQPVNASSADGQAVVELREQPS
ncbi:MAG: efflux RND transporter periplasmic adaptor subunit [Acidiferrobacterales bacterium]